MAYPAPPPAEGAPVARGVYGGAVYWLVRIAVAAVRVLPVRLSYALARVAGVAAYYAWAGGRRRSIANMRRVTGGDDRAARRYARASFGNYAAYLVDFLRFGSLDPDELRARVHFDDWAALEERRAGRGIVFITMHYGNWDLGAAALALHGFPVAVIADTFANERLNDLVLGARAHLGMDVVAAERMGPRILRHLMRNDVVAVLLDVPVAPGESGATTVTFFGEEISVPDGPARLALRAGASVVAATLPRQRRWGEPVRGEVTPVPFTASGDAEVDARALTQAVASALEALVRADPAQWYIFRPLWIADRPAGE